MVAIANPVLVDAFDFEALAAMEEMEQFLANAQEEGYEPRELTELDIRKLVLSRMYLQKDIERLKNLKDAVNAQWKSKIDKVEKQVVSIQETIHNYLEATKTSALPLDVATVSIRKNPHKVIVKDQEHLELHLKNNNLLDQFLKTQPALFDVTAAKNYFLDMLNQHIVNINEGEKQAIADLDAKYKLEVAEIKKAADKKPFQEQLGKDKQDIKRQAAEMILAKRKEFAEFLPDCLEYESDTTGVSIRMNI